MKSERADEINKLRNRLSELATERSTLEQKLSELLRSETVTPPQSTASETPNTPSLSATDKIALFQQLFAGRTDVFPLRWENSRDGRSGYAPACANEWVRGVCGKPQVKCGECPNQAFIPVSPDIIEAHLRGEHRTRRGAADYIAGVYPLLKDETCWFVAVDFDGDHWTEDARAYQQTCTANGVQAALERSRSGNGGHVWIFFAEPVPARDARKLAAWFITETMEHRPEIGFESYDRLFPSQDNIPAGGFGNLIALPLQRRARDQGNSVFVDDQLKPYDDQWAYLASVRRVVVSTLYRLIDVAEQHGVLGVHIPVEDEAADEPWRMRPSRRREPQPIEGPLPSLVHIVLADEVYVDRHELPPSLVARLIRLAAFQNPEFYRAQAMRLPTFGKPRVISCASLHPKHIGLPRGCLDEVKMLFRDLGIEWVLKDQREVGAALDVRFIGALRDEQTVAVDALIQHEFGVLAATTAFGKTVVAAAMIAQRGCNTLILVHRRELMRQWVERLQEFLSVQKADVGTIGGGRRKPTGRIDVALIQSLVRKGEVSDLVSDYGQIIVDECHHLSATSFELVARRSKAQYVLGLSATVARKDGHHPIIFMQCGPVRYRVNPKAQAARRGFEHRVRIRETSFQLPLALPGERPSIPAIYAAIAQDKNRNALIFEDVLTALQAGRCPLILTERRDHLAWLQLQFSRFARNMVVLHGGMTEVARREAAAVLATSQSGERLVLSTGRYLGEGFDDSRLDTLFLTMPISWKGTLAQYVGRLHRNHHDKTVVVVYDYVDSMVPVLARMAARRQAGYRALGYAMD
jgi:superfamily II DNA or RNA helicase